MWMRIKRRFFPTKIFYCATSVSENYLRYMWVSEELALSHQVCSPQQICEMELWFSCAWTASRCKSDFRRVSKFLLQQEWPQWVPVLVREVQLPPCSSFNIVYRLSNSRKQGEGGNSCFSTSSLRKPQTYVEQSRCYFLQYIMTWYMNLLMLTYPLQYAKRLVI